jgi:hypothetical protein
VGGQRGHPAREQVYCGALVTIHLQGFGKRDTETKWR